MNETIKTGRREISITHADRAVFPQANLTKLDLARHYERVAPLMLPYVRDRPLALQAYPQGIEQKGFFLKSVPDYFPAWVKRVTLPKKGGTITHALAQDAATLVYLAGQNVVTVHTWLSRADQPFQPDRLTLDFDPSGGGFAEVRAAARAAGDRLRDLGLTPYAMTTGSRGIHVVCPLRRGPDFPEVHAVRAKPGRGDGGRRPGPPDAGMAQGRPRQADLRRRQPDRLRPARGRAVRGARPTHGAGGGAAALGGALGQGPEAGPLDDQRTSPRASTKAIPGRA